MRTTSICIGLLIAGFMAGCSSNTSPSTSTSFTSASTWIYSDEAFDSTGHSTGIVHDTVTVTNDHTSGLTRTLTLSDTSSMSLTKDGNWVLSTYSENTAICRTFTLPGNVGDTEFFTSIPVKIDGTVEMGSFVATLKSTSSTAVVTAGAFDCYEYEIDGMMGANFQFLRISYYISPAVGLVLRETYSRTRPSKELLLFERKELLSTHQ